jgi:hypothetical protein
MGELLGAPASWPAHFLAFSSWFESSSDNCCLSSTTGFVAFPANSGGVLFSLSSSVMPWQAVFAVGCTGFCTAFFDRVQPKVVELLTKAPEPTQDELWHIFPVHLGVSPVIGAIIVCRISYRKPAGLS